MLEAGGPASALMELAEKQAKLEEENKAATKSPLLQALVQVSLRSRRGFCRTMGRAGCILDTYFLAMTGNVIAQKGSGATFS